MQAPGGPDEDRSGGFDYGGWTVTYFDDYLGKVMTEQMSRPFDLLLGRRTYEIFAAYWPLQKAAGDPVATGINRATKYVVSKTLQRTEWTPSMIIQGDVVTEIRELKEQDRPDLQVHGSAGLVQTLLKNDLVDEFWLKTFPLTIGKGKRLFAEGAAPASFKLLDSRVTPSGVSIANYARAGEVKTGSFA
jgi:dihydrofolate reductase